MSPVRMKAAVTCGAGGRVEIREIPVPDHGSLDVLVKVAAAAGNPVDWKVLDYPTDGNVVGLDFSGTVEELGSDVPAGTFKIGDRVAGAVHGAVSHNGAFAEYVAIPASILLPVPDSWTFEQASQLATATITACLCLYHGFDLPTPLSPTKEAVDILIWGGSSSVGQYAVQFAHLAGLRVITTASPHNFSLVKSLGADLVFSHSDPKTPGSIKGATSGVLKYAVDCISAGETPEKVALSMGDEGGAVNTVLPCDSPRKDVNSRFIVAGNIWGKDMTFPSYYPLDTAQYESGIKAVRVIREVIGKNLLKPGPIKVMPNGLASVNPGLEYMRSGKVSGEKIVYRISDTPLS